jgi:hypothetical protein
MRNMWWMFHYKPQLIPLTHPTSLRQQVHQRSFTEGEPYAIVVDGWNGNGDRRYMNGDMNVVRNIARRHKTSWSMRKTWLICQIQNSSQQRECGPQSNTCSFDRLITSFRQMIIERRLLKIGGKGRQGIESDNRI